VRSTPGELAQIAGVGPAKAAQILAALELGREPWRTRRARVRSFDPARDAAAFLLPIFGSRPTEQFWCGTARREIPGPQDVDRGDRHVEHHGRSAA
jgi:DNA repair protein RadC